jgi:type II secretory pathway pseudopilin PulG
VALAILFFLVCGLLSPAGGGLGKARESAAMQTTRTIALAMFQYANDNGSYPDGKSSTEVFQKLVDGNYISDPAILYVPMPGKTKDLAGARLQPRNVCYDITSGIQMNSPDGLPIVFLTGFRIDYRPGGTAVSLVRPFPGIHHGSSSWWQSINGGNPFEPTSGLPVAYMNNNAYFRNGEIGPDGMGVVRNVLPPDFNANGQIYRQLTPEGVLK